MEGFCFQNNPARGQRDLEKSSGAPQVLRAGLEGRSGVLFWGIPWLGGQAAAKSAGHTPGRSFLPSNPRWQTQPPVGPGIHGTTSHKATHLLS